MSDAPNLLRLFNGAPKDENNVFIADQRTDAFFEGLAKSIPLNPPQLLELAERLSKRRSPNALVNRIVLQAIADMGHDRRMLEILSKVAEERTSWGLSGRELLATITKTYQGVQERWASGTTVGLGPGQSFGGGSGEVTTSTAFTMIGSGCTYQPPSGPAVALAPKQKFVYNSGFVPLNGGGGLTAETIIIVECLGPPLSCLYIETVVHIAG